MFNKFIFVGLIAIIGLTKVEGECANACNGHGKCSSYDMCICSKDWQGNDCSERVCQFGRAHVDTPLGDLNSDGSLSQTLVVENAIVYPYGTPEKFPLMQNTDLGPLDDTAHAYMECSNKGTCDRTSGDCVCYEGFEGAACQRTICPNNCNGHGVCMTKSSLAINDYGNTYNLWDKDVAVGCKCDAGYTGPDCSLKMCKYSVDPLYLDDSATVKYPEFNVAVFTTAATADFTNNYDGAGKWAIRFYDHLGEDWLTQGITSAAHCSDVVAALEALPNKVVPSGSVICFRTAKQNAGEDGGGWDSITGANNITNNNRAYYTQYNLSIWDALLPVGEGDLSPTAADSALALPGSYTVTSTKLSGYIFRLLFTGNPGAIRQPEVEIYLDGTQPSLVSPGGKVMTKVWTDGHQGEDHDYFADHCDNVFVKVFNHAGVSYLGGFRTDAEKALFKSCLGGADDDDTNNVDVYNWDHGNQGFPHFVKLVRAVSSYLDGSYYAALYFDATVNWEDNLHGTASLSTGTFKLVNPLHTPDFKTDDLFEVYTTTGVLAQTTTTADVAVSFGSQFFYTKNTSYTGATEYTYDGDISCETSAIANVNGAYCLNKDDLFTFLNWNHQAYNPPFLNIYTAKNLFTQPFIRSTGGGAEDHYMTHVIKADISSNWGITNVPNTSPFRIYKFFPSTKSTYTYVDECANRGICARDTGLCTCFPGYTYDDCSVQDTLSV